MSNENKYLEKIAKSDHMLKGWISPAWQENAIAKDHGKDGLKGIGANVGAHYGGTARISGRGALEAIPGGLIGAGLGVAASALAAKRGKIIDPTNAGAAGALAGVYGGVLHGAQKSLRNQAAEHHKKYASEGNLSKEAGLKDAAKRVAQAIKSDAGQLGDQVSNARLAIKNNGLFTKGTASTFKTIAKNKAVQLGAGVAGAGAVGGVAVAKKKD